MNNTTYRTDWNNIDMDSPHEASLELLDGLTFETLLTEINCNCQKIDEESVMKQFEEDLQVRIQSAREILQANLQNIIRKAKRDRVVRLS
jgi:hypothetical protein